MRFYLDHAATTPLRSEAREAWLAASDVIGNASSTHGAGQDARRLLEDSRERIAGTLGCDPIEVVLTSGGTESINTALHGLWESRSPDAGATGSDTIVLPDGEHHATMDTVAALAAAGATVRQVPLTELGRIEPGAFAAQLPGAAVATALVANNEVGTVNDAAALAAAAADARVPLHLDAVAALGHLPLSFRSLRGDAAAGTGLVALSVAGHKIGAPVGIGALVVDRTAKIAPLLRGGAQQRGLRAGTQDVPGAAAFAAALVAAEREREGEGVRLRGLRDRLIDGIRSAVPEARLLGDPIERLPGNAHFLFPGAVGESLLFLLDVAGVAASTGSACQAGVAEPSHVVLAMGGSERDARSVLRFTLGRTSADADVDAVLSAIADAYARASGQLNAR
ncbi:MULTISPECIES: cysteine desulfurase family protein [unclassified Microbacterium]|uniref:cysteine desulfurase family protein n=1 Tax=unclassified Microbacterium TaxID=2609290 RepID=UPI001D2D6A39|nr:MULTISPECIES: cysteine desulfurase family protein [unclassified Microbacterium]CAH0160565.1 IscS-like cysteine desulfurase [Microbacterium sp. Bi121]HWK78676.1 cysteine desulfurase family protein [Microbacterium sp.]